MKTPIYLTILGVSAGLLAGCDRDNPPPPAPQDAAHAAHDAAVQTRDEFIASMDKQMAELDAKIDKLSAKAANASGDAKAHYDQALDDLRAQREAVRKEYVDLKASTGDAWDKTKAGFQHAWDKLEKAYDDAAAKISS